MKKYGIHAAAINEDTRMTINPGRYILSLFNYLLVCLLGCRMPSRAKMSLRTWCHPNNCFPSMGTFPVLRHSWRYQSSQKGFFIFLLIKPTSYLLQGQQIMDSSLTGLHMLDLAKYKHGSLSVLPWCCSRQHFLSTCSHNSKTAFT
jgi:hypothetical protein